MEETIAKLYGEINEVEALVNAGIMDKAEGKAEIANLESEIREAAKRVDEIIE